MYETQPNTHCMTRGNMSNVYLSTHVQQKMPQTLTAFLNSFKVMIKVTFVKIAKKYIVLVKRFGLHCPDSSALTDAMIEIVFELYKI